MALDVSTFDALYASHSTRLYSISRRILRDEDLAADVVQEAFVRAYQGADRILDAGPWLTTVVSREAIRRARLRDARDAPLETEGADGETFERPGLVETDPSLDPAHATVAADQLATVWGLVDDLAPDQRAVLTMVAEGRDAPEIAEALGKTANSVYVLVHRARRSVRRRYADRLYGIHGAAATCRGFRDDLLDRIEAPAKATPEFTAHFAACTTCQTIDEELRGASRALGILPLIPAPAGMGEAIRMQVTGAGAPVPGSETGAQAGSATDPTKGGTGTTTHAAVTAIPMKVVMLLVAAIAIVGAVALTQVAVSAPGMASPAATGTPAPAAVVAGPQSAPSPTASPAPSVSTPLPAPSPTASPAPSATASPAPTSAADTYPFLPDYKANLLAICAGFPEGFNPPLSPDNEVSCSSDGDQGELGSTGVRTSVITESCLPPGCRSVHIYVLAKRKSFPSESELAEVKTYIDAVLEPTLAEPAMEWVRYSQKNGEFLGFNMKCLGTGLLVDVFPTARKAGSNPWLQVNLMDWNYMVSNNDKPPAPVCP